MKIKTKIGKKIGKRCGKSSIKILVLCFVNVIFLYLLTGCDGGGYELGPQISPLDMARAECGKIGKGLCWEGQNVNVKSNEPVYELLPSTLCEGDKYWTWIPPTTGSPGQITAMTMNKRVCEEVAGGTWYPYDPNFKPGAKEALMVESKSIHKSKDTLLKGACVIPQSDKIAVICRDGLTSEDCYDLPHYTKWFFGDKNCDELITTASDVINSLLNREIVQEKKVNERIIQR